jgi:16S rRNA (adenine1518-N6/adenine1519-N6)-dimethyltransferase
MQTLTQIRGILESAGLAPRKAMGQNFLIDHNLMGKLLELADLDGRQTVLEVGPGTGSLTEELLSRCQNGKLVCVELDRGLGDVLADRFAAAANFTLIRGDALAGKHKLSPEVIAAVAPEAHLVSNLPYNIATPLLAQCLIDSWRTLNSDKKAEGLCRFNRMTFTVQREVADRLMAGVDSQAYGQVSILVGLLGKTQAGPIVPATAFWPRPAVASRIMRIDFDATSAAGVVNIDVLKAVLAGAFAQRRKQIGSMLRRHDVAFAGPALAEAMSQAQIDPTCRPEQIVPQQYRILANALCRHLPVPGK